MIYFCHQDQTFYDDTIHEHIPETAQAITPEQHSALLNALNSGAKIQADLSIVPRPGAAHTWLPEKQQWVLDKAAQKQIFAAARSAKLAELNTAAQQFIAQAAGTDKVPDFELQSWALQAAEAKAWAQNPDTPTPILDEIAAARGVPTDSLKAAALRKTLAYEKLTAHVVGERQALQTLIEQAKTEADLAQIAIQFTLPESATS